MALSRGLPPRPQVFAAQADAQPFAMLLDAAVSPAPEGGGGAPAASASSTSASPNQQKGADTGAVAQDGAATSESAPSAGNAAQEAANGPPPQSANAAATQGAATDNGKAVPAPGVNDPVNPDPAAAANAAPIQAASADATLQTAAKNGGDRKPGPASNTNVSAVAPATPLPIADGNPNASSATGPNVKDNAAGPSAKDPAATDTADAGKNASNNTAAAAAVSVVVDVSGAVSANAVTPVATKPAGDGKDDKNDQDKDSGDTATALPASDQPPLPSPVAAQPVAAVVVVNPAPDPAPAATAKPGLAIADAVKARPKVMLTSAAMEQTTPAQDSSADAPVSSSTLDSGGSNAAPASSASDGATGDASASDLQQAIDQPQASGANGTALLSQIDFASLGGTARFGLRGDAAMSSNGTATSAAPNAAGNMGVAPNFGIFAPNTVTTNTGPPAAAAAEPAVPLNGLAVAIAARAQAGSSQFDIRLDPPELGRIDVRLDVDGSGQVRTHVTADRADTLQLLQSQQPQLERALEQAGLKTADNGLQFTLRDQSFSGQNGSTGGQHYANQAAAPLVVSDSDAAPIDTAQIYARLRFGNGLDIRV